MKQTIRIIGIPMDLGQKHRGVDMAPIAIRYAGLLGKLREQGYHTEDAGNINVRGHYTLTAVSNNQKIKHIVKACKKTYEIGKKAIEDNEIPLFLGGDHSIAIGSIGGITDSDDCGVIWIDAHGDFNTPATSPSGNIHGMTLGVLLGNGDKDLVNIGRKGSKLKPENVVLLGIRSLDSEERKRLSQSGCNVYTMREIDERGIHAVLQEALANIAHIKTLHVSLDMDAIDPHEAPGVGTPVHGGLSYREAQLIMETLADTKKVRSADVVEVNPILDVQNKTAQVAVSLVASLFGKSIL
jgi:arginase